MTLLLREAIGGGLRRVRTARCRTLRDVSGAARVSLGYLSEVERGRKEASSELLAAICDALELPLPELLDEAARTLRPTAIGAAGVGEVDGGRLVESAVGTLVAGQADLRLAPVLGRPLPAPVSRQGDDAVDHTGHVVRAGVVVAA